MIGVKKYWGLLLFLGLYALWVGLVVISFFSSCIYESDLIWPGAITACVIWACLFLWRASSRVDGSSSWGRVYRGELVGFRYKGKLGVAAMLLVIVAGGCLSGCIGVGIFAAPIRLLATSSGSATMSVSDISYFRGSITHTYIIDVSGKKYSGKFLWDDRDPALSQAHITNNISTHDIRCLKLDYRYWYFGAVVESISRCA